MCEFCIKHGEGKRWYLEAKNYGEDLWHDLKRRKVIADFFYNFQEDMGRSLRQLDGLRSAPKFVQSLVSRLVTRQYKRRHFGQVVPWEDVERIFQVVNSVVRVPCVCRRLTTGREDRFCFGISIDTREGLVGEVIDPSYWKGPDGKGLEHLEKPIALDMMKDFEKDGLFHSVWTFVAPFVAAICNCDRSDCLAMRMTVTSGMKVMFKAEYVASVDWDKCNGCRSCMRVCQFGAVGYSAGAQRAKIDAYHCYGCGVCRSVCENDAIMLQERTAIPAVANDW